MPSPTPQPTNTPEPSVFAEIVSDSSGAISYSGPNQPAPSNPTYSGNKYILVDISEQHMYVYEGDALVYSFVASTGMNNATRVGTFSVLDKIPSAYGSTWDIWMPNWLGIYYSGHLENGIHALPILPNGATLWEGYLCTGLYDVLYWQSNQITHEGLKARPWKSMVKNCNKLGVLPVYGMRKYKRR
jgi:hypothetical protein